MFPLSLSLSLSPKGDKFFLSKGHGNETVLYFVLVKIYLNHSSILTKAGRGKRSRKLRGVYILLREVPVT